MSVKRHVCPGCGAAWNGRRCRSCGYKSFPNAVNAAPAVPVRKKEKRTYPLLRFLLLLYLIYALMPLFRNWGLKLEAMEDAARQPETSCHTESIPADQK